MCAYSVFGAAVMENQDSTFLLLFLAGWWFSRVFAAGLQRGDFERLWYICANKFLMCIGYVERVSFKVKVVLGRGVDGLG